MKTFSSEILFQCFLLFLQMIEEAELEWIFLHPLPRTEIEVSDSVFRHKNNLTWHATANYLYITMVSLWIYS